MNAKLLATIFRWIARVAGTVLVGLTLFMARGVIPRLFTQPFVIQIYFLALMLVLLGILVAWRWELPGGIMSFAGWVLFIVLQTVMKGGRHSLLLVLWVVPSLLFLGSSFLRRYHEKYKST